MSQLFQTVALLLAFELDVHHQVLLTFASVYDVLPVGRGFAIEPMFGRMSEMVGASIVFAVRYAMPVIGVMVLLTAVLVMLARAVPNINLLEFGFGLRILLALTASVYFLTSGTPFLERMFDTLLAAIGRLFAEA
jgi:flagellar biosynthetic protein FliR